MKYIKILAIVAALSFAPLLAGRALAYYPQMTLSTSGSSTTIYISGAQPSAAVVVSYNALGSSLNLTVSGMTDYSGSFTTMVSSANSSSITATVGGQQIVYSNNNNNGSGCGYYGCNTCTYNCGSPTGLSLSQNSLSLNVGQTMSVTIYNNSSYNNYNSYTITSGTSSSVASANISGNTITVYAYQSGTTSFNICQNYYSSGCVGLTVTVNGSVLGASNYQVQIRDNYFSPSTITIPQGSSVTWQNYGSMSHTVTSDNNNFNSGTLSVGGSFTQVFNTPGTYYYHCNFHSGMTGSVTVTGNGGSVGGLTLSQTSVSLNVGQTSYVTASQAILNPSFYISSNSNSAVVSASISGNQISLYSLASGNSTITVCANGGSACGNIYVTVAGSGGYGSNIYFSPNSLNLTVGQSGSVTVTGPYGYNFYISGNSNPTVASAVMNNNTLTVSGTNTGYTTFTVCQNSQSQCGSLGVTVNNGGYGGYGTLSLSQTSVSLTPNQTTTITAYNYGNNVYISNNTNPNVVAASISANLITLRGQNSGNATVTVCSNNSSQCGSIYVTVSGGVQYPGGGVLGASTFNSGQLISENGTVYIVYRSSKSGFVSAPVFRGFGFSFGNVVYTSNSGLSDSGYTIRSLNASHPWGTWIKSGNTVYFVHEDGLIAVPSWDVFLNNGGSSNLIVPANHYDFNLSILQPMTYNDSRLQ